MAAQVEVVRVLVTELQSQPSSGSTPLFVAAQEGHLEVVLLLVTELGTKVNQTVKDGATPLFAAVQYGHLEVVRAKLGAEVDLAMENSATPLVARLLVKGI